MQISHSFLFLLPTGLVDISTNNQTKVTKNFFIIFLKMMSYPTNINRDWLKAISCLSLERAKYWERSSQQSDYTQVGFISLSIHFHCSSSLCQEEAYDQVNYCSMTCSKLKLSHICIPWRVFFFICFEQYMYISAVGVSGCG